MGLLGWATHAGASDDCVLQRGSKGSAGVKLLGMQGLERAAAVGVKEVAVFPAATEAFSKKNLNASIANILARSREVVAAAKEQDIAVRGYVSCALGCPYQVPNVHPFAPFPVLLERPSGNHQLKCSD